MNGKALHKIENLPIQNGTFLASFYLFPRLVKFIAKKCCTKMEGFKPRSFGYRSDCSSICATKLKTKINQRCFNVAQR